jgi:glutathione synthase/RimK-type ligase-like ATP-grasp enzyme
MTTTNFVFPYRQGSESARSIASCVRGRVIRVERSRYRPTAEKAVINWGATSLPRGVVEDTGVFLNHPDNVRNASNKLRFFRGCEGHARTPRWTTDKETVRQWWADTPDLLVFARRNLAGHSGEGIHEVTNEEELAAESDGVLLVEYIKKAHEFRLHVGKRDEEDYTVFCTQQKRRNMSVPDEEVNWRIRNHTNGFIFAQQQIVLPDDVTVQAVAAFRSTGLDFGAVDVIYNERHENAYVLEINTAPGVTGSTLEAYGDFLNEVLNHRRGVA